MKKSEDYYYYYRTTYGYGTFNVGDLVLTITSYTAKFCKNGKLHRLDGPAMIRWDKTTEWWINDNPVTDIITNWAKENDIDLYNLSEDDKRLIRLVWFDYGK